MRRAQRETEVEQRPERPAHGPLRDAARGGPESILFLQSAAGNAAVARSLLAREPAAPGADLEGGSGDVTITAVLRNFNLPKSGDASKIDFLHEPGVSIKIAPEEAPKPVVEAALAAFNLHLQRHGHDIVQLAVVPHGAIGGGHGPHVGVEAEVDIHVSSTFSITAATALSASAPAKPGEQHDPGHVPLAHGSTVDLNWSPFSVGILYQLDGGHKSAPEKGKDSSYYESIMPGHKTIAWVAAQLSPAEFTTPGASDSLDITGMVTNLFDAMKKGGSEVWFDVDLGVQQEPPGLAQGLTRAATLLASARPDLAHVQSVKLAISQLPPDGKGTSRAKRWKQLAIGAAPVEPPTPAPAPSPPIRTWGTGPPVAPTPAPAAPSGPKVLGSSKVLPAAPPVLGVQKNR
jgi:hypothetical protein